MMKSTVLAALMATLVSLSAQATPRFIGPWFTDTRLNTATGTSELIAGQNTAALGIRFSCFDQHLSLGVWKPGSGLQLAVPNSAQISITIDNYQPIEVKGYVTGPNLVEFSQSVDLMMRQMLVGHVAHVVLVDGDGGRQEEIFQLANTQLAFASLQRACKLQ